MSRVSRRVPKKLWCLLVLGSLSCGARYPCLSGSLEEPYRDLPSLKFLQREFERAKDAEPAIGARMLEALPELFPDLSDRSNAPECSPQLMDELEARLSQRPLPWNNATLHTLAALGNVRDTSDVMDRKATLLLGLATLADDALEPYQMTEGETGQPPGAKYLRRRATAELVHSNLYLNDARVRRFLIEKALRTHDPHQKLLFLYQTATLPWQPGENNLAVQLKARRLESVRRALDEPSTLAGFELLLEELQLLSRDPSPKAPVRAVLERIIASDGALPVTQGHQGWARDLAARARQCRWDLDDPEHSFGPDFMDVPLTSRDAVDPTEGVFDDPTSIEWTQARVAERQRSLAAELTSVQGDKLRCWLLEQAAHWALPADRHKLMLGWLEDANAPACAFMTALNAEELPASVRQAHIARLIEAEPFHGLRGAPLVAGRESRARMARSVLARNLAWLSSSEKLRAVVVADAVAEPPNLLWANYHSVDSIGLLYTRFAYQRVLHTVVWLDAHAGAERKARARVLVAHWVELLKALETPSFTNFYSSQTHRALLYDVAELAPELGLQAELSPLLSREGRDYDLARWLFERSAGSLQPGPAAAQ